MTVRRVYVQKRPGLRHEAEALKAELRDFLGLKGLKDVQIINRYDVQGLDEAGFAQALRHVLTEPQADDYFFEPPAMDQARAFALEYLPGQFDQRADSAAQCIQLLTMGERPQVRTARLYLLDGDISPADTQAALRYVLNPVESREAAPELPDSLDIRAGQPEQPPVLSGFRQLDAQGIQQLRREHELAIEEDDIRFCMAHFEAIGRDPVLTEIKVIDTYWSDHCRHTTFLTELTDVEIAHPAARAAWQEYVKVHEAVRPGRPHTLMDVATLAASALHKAGHLPALVDSEENNACTIRVTVDTPGGPQDWLLLFKNETHNHPTEIEPFGGAATCIGGAIRDPMSARAYVYAAMRVTGTADPTAPSAIPSPASCPSGRS